MRKRNFFEEEEHIEALTPLIDTVFVLLIIFIIMSVTQKKEQSQVLPSVESVLTKPVDNKYFLLAVDQYKNIFLSEKKKLI